MLEAGEINEAHDFLGQYPDTFIGGSYIVDPVKAKDIDIVVPLWAYDVEAYVEAGFEQYTHDNADLYADEDLQRIVSIWRRGDINLLVIKPIYYAAYLGAVAAMRNDPVRYAEREARVVLHITLCKQAKDLAKGLSVPPLTPEADFA